MATPTYKGQGQPPATSGGWLSNWFGASTPAYKAAPTAASNTASAATPSSAASTTNPSGASRRTFFGLAAPAYKLAPQPSENDCASEPQEFAIVIPRQAIEPQE